MEDGIKERILIILPSILTNQDSSQGVKAKYLLELDAKLNKKGIKLTIATVKKTQPLINYLKEEKFKKYIISLINSEDNEDFVAVDKINIKLYKGVIIPSYISIYKEYLENQFGQILLEFHKQNKLILCLGHSTIVLASMKLQNKFPFEGFNVTGCSVKEFIEENLLNEVKYSSEELFISKGAIFIRPEEGEFLNQNSNVKSYYDSLKSEITTENYVKIIYSTNFSDNRTNTCLCIQHENLITGNNCSSFNLCCEVFLENI